MWRRTWIRVLLALVLLASTPPATHAGDGEEAPYGGTYTPAELEALDRALHAGNLTREDLRFRKDVAEGRACLPVVRDLLHDPLAIAPLADRLAAQVLPSEGPMEPGEAIRAAFALLEPGRPLPPRGPAVDLPHEPRALIERLAALLGEAGPPRLVEEEAWDAVAWQALRRHLPAAMAWHEVFASPWSAEEDAAIDLWAGDQPRSWVHDRAARIDLEDLVRRWRRDLEPLVDALLALPPEAFPTQAPLILDTPAGRVALGTHGDDVYEGDFAVLVEPGGDDRYVGGRLGAAAGTPGSWFGLFLDLGGDDVHACGEVDVTHGAAVMGIAFFADLGAGNDRYEAGHASLGAAMGGIAVFLDDGGSDVYEGRTFTQGAAGFGIGILLDDARQPRPVVPSDEATPDPVSIGLLGNDRLRAWSSAQAFARCRGIAVCANRRGNDVYEAGGVYLHAPLFADRYQSFCQGFAIGQRDVDYAGGVALLLDGEGNDRYLGDVYAQGVGYWYGAGLLWDGGGNDLYEMTQYGQGSGIHLAVGGLVDVAGSDTYVLHSGLGQGGSHDYAASVLHDRGGDDRYLGSTACNGCGLTNAVGLFFDRGGSDIYAARREGGLNLGRPARGFPSIGVLVDLGGKDDYLGAMEDGAAWRHGDLGVGVDLPGEEGEGEGASGPDPAPSTGQGAPMPAVVSWEGALTQEVFDELWQVAIRWEVGENRRIVPAARRRIVAFGPEVVPLLDAAMDHGASGLELRAYVDVLRGLAEAGHREAAAGLLRRNLATESARRRTVALRVTEDLAWQDMAPDVLPVLQGPDASLARRAAATLARLGSALGEDVLLGWLDAERDERDVQAALGALLGRGAPVYARVRPLLDHPLLSVRGRLVALLAERYADYGSQVEADVGAPDLAPRARRDLLDVLRRSSRPPSADLVRGVAAHLDAPDWGLRGDVARLLRHWESLEASDAAALAPALERLDALLGDEADPYVRTAGARR